MDEIVEVRRCIRSLSFERSRNKTTFSLGITYWHDRSGDCTNPGDDRLHVSVELKRGGKSGSLQDAMKVVLKIWKGDSRINCMNWDKVLELLYKAFKPKK